MKKTVENLLTIGWAIKLGIKINARIFIFWSVLGVSLSILPAVALFYNREAVSILSDFLARGEGSFQDILPSLISLGIVLTAIGVSRRITGNFLYIVMYDAYYHGMQEYLMDVANSIELRNLMHKKFKDDFYAAYYRCGSLADFMSSGTLFLSKFTGAVSLLVIAVTVSNLIFITAAIYIVVVLFFNILVAKKLRFDFRVHSQAHRLARYYQDSVMKPGVAKELRVYDLCEETIDKWEDAYNDVEQFERQQVKYLQIASIFSTVGFYLLIVLMMVYSVFNVANGNMTVDVFLMLYAMGQSISEVTRVLTSSLQETDRGLYFLVIQRKFIKSVPKDAKNQQDGFEAADENIVFQAKDLCFIYDDERNILDGLNFTIRKGETIALVGVNGSGKTTLVKLLIGLFAPTKGQIRFYGKPYTPHTRGAITKRVGMFFQDFSIFHASLRENVGFGDLKNMGNEKRIRLAIEKGDAETLLKKLSNRLDQWLNRNVKKDGAMLSGGEKQRVAVSRAHMSDKDVLIFDEPAAALDPIAEMKQFHTIHEKIQGRTAILISHRIGFARLANRIMVLDKGRLVETGTHDELMTKSGVYFNFYNEQAGWYSE